MPSLTFLIPGDLETRTGGYEYDRRIATGLRTRGWSVEIRPLDGSFPQPSAAALNDANAVLASIDDGALVLVDGLALGAMPEQAAAHAGRLQLMAMLHHPLALETGLSAEHARTLRESERLALRSAARVIVTSPLTARALADYDVPAARIVVIEPGTEPAPLARGSADATTSLVCVASLSPRKGHEVLFRALGSHTRRDWRLVCVGDYQRDPPHANRLRSLLRELGIAGRVALVGEADAADTAAFYDAADAFVLPTFYEGYGMAVAEALARGLPVISTPTGAIADLIGTGAGLLVEAGDVAGWAHALTQVFDPTTRSRLTAGARSRRLALATWDVAAERLAAALQRHG